MKQRTESKSPLNCAASSPPNAEASQGMLRGPRPAEAPTRSELAVLEQLAVIGSLVRACHRQMGAPLIPADLDEVIQETSLIAWEQRGKFRGESDVEVWLYGIARHRVLQHLRRNRRARYVDADMAEVADVQAGAGPGSGSQADASFEGLLSAGLSEIGTTLGLICRARAVEGRSFAEISTDLRLTPANVKTRFYRSLPELRRRFRFLRN